MSRVWWCGLRIIHATLVIAAHATLPGEAYGQVPEYELKGEFIERFSHFIDWPPTAFSSPDAPFIICLLKENPFGDYLNRLARGGAIKGRKIQISQTNAITALDGCHMVFITASEKDRVSAVVDRTKGKPILTIGDTPGFAQAGIIINFYIANELVRFEINIGEAKLSGLKFSSQLLKLARLVGE